MKRIGARRDRVRAPLVRCARPGARPPPHAPRGGAAAEGALRADRRLNASVDRRLAPLQYADDDAARYLDLFRALGARTYLLTRARRQHAPPAPAGRRRGGRRGAPSCDARGRAARRATSRRRARAACGRSSTSSTPGTATSRRPRATSRSRTAASTGADLARDVVDRGRRRREPPHRRRLRLVLARLRRAGRAASARDRCTASRSCEARSPSERVGLLLSTLLGAREPRVGAASRPASSATRCAPASTARPTPTATAGQLPRDRRVRRARQRRDPQRALPAARATRAPPQGSDTLLDLRAAHGRRIEIDGERAGTTSRRRARRAHRRRRTLAPGITVRIVARPPERHRVRAAPRRRQGVRAFPPIAR